MLRRVVGDSMLPGLKPGQVVWARRHFANLKVGDVVVVKHGGLEKIKRLKQIDGEHVFVVGDNAAASTDSRQFGWLPRADVVAKVRYRR